MGSNLYQENLNDNKEGSGDYSTEPLNSDVQNEKSNFDMDQVRNYIIELMRDEAPKSMYHSFSRREIIQFVRDKFQGIAVGPVYDLIKQLYDQGVIFKPSGKNFAYNWEAG